MHNSKIKNKNISVYAYINHINYGHMKIKLTLNIFET